MDDYRTITGPSSAKYTEKMSRFLAFAHPADSAGEAKAVVAQYQREYHDARHVCYAWMVGPDRSEAYSNDNGEPSGTAGKPILGQINSFGLTNVVVVVVRYFGGIKLGTSGLIAAYREAARMALEEAGKVDRKIMSAIEFTFPYLSMNDVMKLTKSDNVEIVSQIFDNTCTIVLATPRDNVSALRSAVEAIDGVSIISPL